MMATGLAAGILLDATVIRALIVPAVISLMGRWNWWLPELARAAAARGAVAAAAAGVRRGRGLVHRRTMRKRALPARDTSPVRSTSLTFSV